MSVRILRIDTADRPPMQIERRCMREKSCAALGAAAAMEGDGSALCRRLNRSSMDMDAAALSQQPLPEAPRRQRPHVAPWWPPHSGLGLLVGPRRGPVQAPSNPGAIASTGPGRICLHQFWVVGPDHMEQLHSFSSAFWTAALTRTTAARCSGTCLRTCERTPSPHRAQCRGWVPGIDTGYVERSLRETDLWRTSLQHHVTLTYVLRPGCSDTQQLESPWRF